MELRKAFIYRYKEHGNTPLCIYICDTQTKGRILIVPLTPHDGTDVYKISVTNQYADLKNYKEISTSTIVAPLYLNSRAVKINKNDLSIIQNYIINSVIENIEKDIHTYNQSLILFESIYQFLKWKWQKLLLNVAPYQKKTTVYENGIYWASLGINVGSELNKNRPVLIWKKRCQGTAEASFSYIVIPITSKEKSKKYYMNVPIDINGRNCYLRIEDMRRINIKRISRPILNDHNQIIFISNEKRKEIIEAIQKFFIFENSHKSS